jgi:hypothetical protein
MRRKKYGRAIGEKTGPPIALLAQMFAITNAQQTADRPSERESPVMSNEREEGIPHRRPRAVLCVHP